MAAAELNEAADAAVLDIDNQTSKDVTSSPSNKRKRSDGDDQTGKDSNSNSNNKRRKKKKGGGGGKKQHHNKQKRNWIEVCSESITRIPSNCVAPVTCVITRSEIEEEPLLPKQVGDDVTQSEDTKHTLDRDDDDGADEVDCSSNNEPTESNTSSIEHPANNIATLSKSFVDTLSKEPKQPWKIATTLQVNGEEKKVFIPVQRHASTNGPTKWQQNQKKQGRNKKGQNYSHLPDGDNGDGKKNPFPKKAVPDKFWAQRKRLFSRYDEGIQIGGEDDPEMWYSVTPESIGLHIANRMASMMNLDRKSASGTGAGDASNTQCNDLKTETVIIDAFCGCGGNSIAFARLNKNKDVAGSNTRVKVIAVDNNLSRLKMAANNASIYGISKEDIVLVHADAVEVVNAYEGGSRKNVQSEIPTNDRCCETYFGFAVGGVELLPDHVDALFLSPPWGGMDYDNNEGKSGFDPVNGITLESKIHNKEGDVMKTNGGELLNMAAKAVLSESKQEGLVVAFLPRNIDGISFTRVAVTSGIKGSIELEQNVVNGKVKTVTAYLGHV
eukprot:scaffold9692_cov117-Skeletonema_dohrnii-CCMP3373.AAC.5